MPQFATIKAGRPALRNSRRVGNIVGIPLVLECKFVSECVSYKEKLNMLTLSYGVLFGLLLAAFLLGLIFPVILVIYLVVNNPPR